MMISSGLSDNFSLFNQSMAGFFNESKSAVIDNRYRQELVSKSRVLIQKVPLAKAVIDIMTRGVVGSGLHLKNSNDVLEVLSALHMFDAQKQLDLYQMQQTVWSTVLSCGECFLIRQRPAEENQSPNSHTQYSSWYIAEPDHVFNPPYVSAAGDGNYYYKSHLLIDGIEFKNDGTPWAIHYCKAPYTGNVTSKTNWQRIFIEDREGIPNVIHVKLTDRPEYPRGLPILAPLIESLYSLYAYQQAQIQMGIVQSCQAFVIKTEDTNKSLNPFQGLSSADMNAPIICSSAKEDAHEASKDFSIVPPNNTDVFGLTTTANYIRPGQSYHLGVNESIEHLTTTGPSNSLTEYYNLVVEQVGAALGIPPAVLKGVFDVSFSSSKCSVAQWNYTVSKYKRFIEEQLLKPLYRVFLYEYLNGDVKESLMEAVKSEWQKQDSTMLLDEARSAKFVQDCLEMGIMTREEASQRLLGHALDADAKIIPEF